MTQRRLRGDPRACSTPELGPQRCTILGKNPDSEARQTWVLLLALPLASCVILGKSLNLSGLHVLHQQNGTDDHHTDHTGRGEGENIT